MEQCMSTRTYEADFHVHVTITVPEEAVTRVLENEDGWQDTYYKLDEEGVVEMLARCCGIQNSALHQLDGWADLRHPNQFLSMATTKVDYDMESWERVKEPTS
jgi:hypothetical protein